MFNPGSTSEALTAQSRPAYRIDTWFLHPDTPFVAVLLHRADVWLFPFVLAFIYPVTGHLFYGRLKSTMKVYMGNILAAWFLTAVAVFLIYRSGLQLSDFALKSIWAGLLISSILFGFAHLYQGRKGMLSMGMVSLLFGLIYVAGASLLAAQVLPSLLDLNKLLSFGKVAWRAGAASAPEPAT